MIYDFDNVIIEEDVNEIEHEKIESRKIKRTFTLDYLTNTAMVEAISEISQQVDGESVKKINTSCFEQPINDFLECLKRYIDELKV